MKNIVILGNSVVATRLIEEIRKIESSMKITLIAVEEALPYDRQQLPLFVTGAIKESDVFQRPKEFYQTNDVDVVVKEKVTRINLKRKQVFTESKARYDFDAIVLTDVPDHKLPAVKGHHKNGVFGCWRLGDVKKLLKQLSFTDTVVVQVTSAFGLNMACALTEHKKEVIVVYQEKQLFGKILDEESANMLKQLLEHQGVRVIASSGIEEVIGETDVKAVRLKGGKVIACETVVFDEGTPDLKVFSESALSGGGHWTVDPHLNVLGEYAFLADTLYGMASMTLDPLLDVSAEELEEQARVIVSNLLGQKTAYSTPIRFHNLVKKGLTGFWVGTTHLEQGAREFLKFDPQNNIYKKVFAKDKQLVGAVIYNDPKDLEKIRSIMTQAVDVTGVEDYLLEDNFTVDEIIKLQKERTQS